MPNTKSLAMSITPKSLETIIEALVLLEGSKEDWLTEAFLELDEAGMISRKAELVKVRLVLAEMRLLRRVD